MIKVHSVSISDGSRVWSYIINGTKTNAKGREVPLSKQDARDIAISRVWKEEFESHGVKRINGISVQQLSAMSDSFRWAFLQQSFEVTKHVVKTFKEGDVSLSTKRNPDGTKKRKRNSSPAAPHVDAPKSDNTATLPNGVKVAAA